MRTKAMAFLILAILTPLSGSGSVGWGKFEPYDDFKKKEFRRIDLKEASDFGHKYLQEIHNVVKGKNVTLGGIYTQTAQSYDNTAALLGFHFGKAWKGEDPKGESDAIKKQVRDALIDAFLKRSDNGLAALNDNALKTQAKALATLLMAGISYGHIINPNENHPQNYKDNKKPYYGFRLGQQAIRNAVLESYTTYIINLKSEVAWFYENINKYCPSVKLDDQRVKLGRVDPDEDFNKIPVYTTPQLRGFPTTFMMVNRLLLNQNAGLGNVECLKLLGMLTHMKIELANAELMLALLATQYAMLNNQEKGWLR